MAATLFATVGSFGLAEVFAAVPTTVAADDIDHLFERFRLCGNRFLVVVGGLGGRIQGQFARHRLSSLCRTATGVPVSEYENLTGGRRIQNPPRHPHLLYPIRPAPAVQAIRTADPRANPGPPPLDVGRLGELQRLDRGSNMTMLGRPWGGVKFVKDL